MNFEEQAQKLYQQAGDDLSPCSYMFGNATNTDGQTVFVLQRSWDHNCAPQNHLLSIFCHDVPRTILVAPGMRVMVYQIKNRDALLTLLEDWRTHLGWKAI